MWPWFWQKPAENDSDQFNRKFLSLTSRENMIKRLDQKSRILVKHQKYTSTVIHGRQKNMMGKLQTGNEKKEAE